MKPYFLALSQSKLMKSLSRETLLALTLLLFFSITDVAYKVFYDSIESQSQALSRNQLVRHSRSHLHFH